MARIEFQDESAVVIIGSGAGGGTLAHELTRRGIKVVVLEAGKRQSTATFSQVPGEAFLQLTWLDARTQSGDWGVAKNFPHAARMALQNGWRNNGALDRSHAAFRTLGVARKEHLRQYPRHIVD